MQTQQIVVDEEILRKSKKETEQFVNIYEKKRKNEISGFIVIPL